MAIIAALSVSARPATKRIAFAVTARAPACAVYDALCDPTKLLGATSASSPPTAAPRVVQILCASAVPGGRWRRILHTASSTAVAVA